MALYIDSSFLLNIIYLEEGFETNLEYFNSDKIKFSSVLLEIETLRSINNFYSLNKKYLDKSWIKEAETNLNEFISQINLKYVDIHIQMEAKRNKNLFELKSLDLIHLASAIYLKKMISDDIIICTLDDKLKTVSKKFGFKLYQE